MFRFRDGDSRNDVWRNILVAPVAMPGLVVGMKVQLVIGIRRGRRVSWQKQGFVTVGMCRDAATYDTDHLERMNFGGNVESTPPAGNRHFVWAVAKHRRLRVLTLTVPRCRTCARYMPIEVWCPLTCIVSVFRSPAVRFNLTHCSPTFRSNVVSPTLSFSNNCKFGRRHKQSC